MKIAKFKPKWWQVLPIGILLIFISVFFIGYAPEQSLQENFNKGIDTIVSWFTPTNITITPTTPNIPQDEEPDEPTHTPTWTQVGTGSGWSFIGSGDHNEWTINLGDIRIGTGGTTTFKIEVWRRWNFKSVFECGESTLIWCLHDSSDNQIWKQTDSTTILTPGRTDTITSFVLYDGRPWRMFIGNNFPCDVDCHWSISVYELI